MPSLGGAASGAGTGAALGSFIPGIGTGIGAGIGGLIGLFTGGKKKKDDDVTQQLNPLTQQLQESSTGLRAQGRELTGQGTEALQPVLQYLQRTLGGDPAAMAEAVKPETGRVIDQFDSARRAALEFGPRGGGTSSASANSYTQEAMQLSDITSASRKGAAEMLAQIGPQLEGLGLSAEQLASADLNSIIQSVLYRKQLDLQKRGQNMEALGGLGEGLGSILGSVILNRGSGGGKGTI